MSSTPAAPHGLLVKYDVFLGVIWACFAVSTIFVALRLYLRWHGPRRLYLEDAFLLFAYILSPISAALWQWAAQDMYYTLNVQAGFATYEADYLQRLRRWLIVNLIVELFFYSSLLSIKLSFLFFFKRLGNKVQGQKFIWWPVLLFSITAFLVSLGDVQYKCLVGPMSYIVSYCGTSPAGRFVTITLQVNCVLDVVSDFLIILIPITMLWNVRIPKAKKLALMGLFSLSIITIGMAIARAADLTATRQTTGDPDPSYLWLWSCIQSTLAVVIACLIASPQLFTQGQSTRPEKPVWAPTDTYYKRLASRMKTKKRHDPLYDLSTITQCDRHPQEQHDHTSSPQEGLKSSTVLCDKQVSVLVEGCCEELDPTTAYGSTTLCISQGPVFVNEGGTAVTAWPNEPRVPGAVLQYNQITQQFEYGECRGGLSSTETGWANRFQMSTPQFQR